MTVFSLDREEALRRVREAAERLGRERPEVRFVGLFGSLAKGTAVPGSDADLIVVLDPTDLRFLDRPLRYGPYFEGVGLDVDLFCYTPEELPRTPLARTALREALPLWGNLPEPGATTGE
ncbi:nucleotidyltransferase domain-containing protein [Deferrisoma palaeochoriense]